MNGSPCVPFRDRPVGQTTGRTLQVGELKSHSSLQTKDQGKKGAHVVSCTAGMCLGIRTR
jgi:hypothetical protein